MPAPYAEQPRPLRTSGPPASIAPGGSVGSSPGSASEPCGGYGCENLFSLAFNHQSGMESEDGYHQPGEQRQDHDVPAAFGVPSAALGVAYSRQSQGRAELRRRQSLGRGLALAEARLSHCECRHFTKVVLGKLERSVHPQVCHIA